MREYHVSVRKDIAEKALITLKLKNNYMGNRCVMADFITCSRSSHFCHVLITSVWNYLLEMLIVGFNYLDFLHIFVMVTYYFYNKILF